MSDAVQSTTEITPVQSAQPVAKKSNTGKILIGCCLVFLCLICLCCSALAAIFGSTGLAVAGVVGELQTSVTKLCSANSTDLKSFYDNYTTTSFKKITSQREFLDFYTTYKDIIIDCKGINDNSFWTSKVNGAKVNFENKNGVESLQITYPSQGYTVYVEFIKESASWKVNAIQID